MASTTECSVDGCSKALHPSNTSGMCKPHRLQANNARWRAANTEYNRERAARWHAENRERTQENFRRWSEENREHRAAYMAKYLPAWRADNPDAIQRYRGIIRVNRRARVTGALIETPTRSAVYARTGGQCHVCLRPIEFDSDWHSDHVFPLCLGGIEHPENMAATHAVCNMRKARKFVSAMPWIESAALGVCVEFNLASLH